METVDWATGRWTSPPVRSEQTPGGLLVEAKEGSDAWRTTSYGFIHYDEHALIAPLGREQAIEVDFWARFSQQFDQAGVFLRVDESHWVKAGVEFADGTPQVGAVVTDVRSDWSVAPVPDWGGRLVTIRASRSGDAITVRARVEGEDFRLVRLIPMSPDVELEAGPFICSPTRAGLEVLFTGWRLTEPDASLHP